MLEILKIKNIAIIDIAEIHFKSGLNIISGETGAGKSIIIEAIALLLGGRTRLELIRSGSDEGLVEGVFQTSEIPWIHCRLKKLGFNPEENELIIKRTVHRSGKHRISINGELATLTTLHSLCEGLIDLCGQQEHQSLLKPSRQIELLDSYAHLTEQTKKIENSLRQLQVLTEKKEHYQKKNEEKEKIISFLKYKIQEIRNANLKPNEDHFLQAEKQLLQSVETRIQLAETTCQILEAEEHGTINTLRSGAQKLRHLTSLDKKAIPFLEALERSIAEIEEVILGLNRYLSKLDLDPLQLQTIQDRLSLIHDLRRKYGNDLTEIFALLKKYEEELNTFETEKQTHYQLTQEIAQFEEKILEEGKNLSEKRGEHSKLLETKITSELKNLKMEDARFYIEIHHKKSLYEWNFSGGDLIQFFIQTNRGESSRPLAKIASGGELSRLLLAIRHVISDRGGIGVYLFDEIDAGIGGQTAFEVGKKLKSVSRFNQVICITHLPQIAAFAHHHLVVQKIYHGKRTKTEITGLCISEKQEELARMLGGPKLSQKSLDNASELLELANKHTIS